MCDQQRDAKAGRIAERLDEVKNGPILKHPGVGYFVSFGTDSTIRLLRKLFSITWTVREE
jgi:hypothetical protein